MKLKPKRFLNFGTEKIYEILKNSKFSLAFAEIRESKLHLHKRATELYLVCDGEGVLFLGSSKIRIRKGDVVRIPPNTPHKVMGKIRLFVISHPPWNENDHVLLE